MSQPVDAPEFEAEVTWDPPDLLTLEIGGYMGPGAEAYLERVATHFRSAASKVRVLFLVRGTFRGFHSSQVMIHGRFFTRHRARLAGIAVARAPATVTMAASTVAAVTRIPVKTFGDRESAEAWLRAL